MWIGPYYGAFQLYFPSCHVHSHYLTNTVWLYIVYLNIAFIFPSWHVELWNYIADVVQIFFKLYDWKDQKILQLVGGHQNFCLPCFDSEDGKDTLTNCQTMPHNFPEEWRPQLYTDRSLKASILASVTCLPELYTMHINVIKPCLTEQS